MKTILIVTILAAAASASFASVPAGLATKATTDTAAPLLIEARRGRGADDPAGHVRGGHGTDDPAGHAAATDIAPAGGVLVIEARRGRGTDDPAGHVRRGRGKDDPVGHG